MLEHWHTGAMTRTSEILDGIEPEAILCMNAVDMKKMMIEPGQNVKVSTRRGNISVAVRQDWQLPEGMIFMPFFFNCMRPLIRRLWIRTKIGPKETKQQRNVHQTIPNQTKHN